MAAGALCISWELLTSGWTACASSGRSRGDHYAENGQRVFSAIIEGSSYVTGPRAIKRSLRPLNSVLTIVEEDTGPQAVAWWEGFTPSPKEVPPESKS
jgi:GTP-dependent phosphoenolpyruvate carboxykinase